MEKYRVIAVFNGGQGCQDEIQIKTPWFNSYERAKEEKEKLEAHDNYMRKTYGYGYFIGWYKIQKMYVKTVIETL